MDDIPFYFHIYHCQDDVRIILREVREGVQKNNDFFSSLLLLRGPATPPPPLSSPVDNLDFRSIF